MSLSVLADLRVGDNCAKCVGLETVFRALATAAKLWPSPVRARISLAFPRRPRSD